MLLQKSILVPFTTTRTLKILYIRKSGVDMEAPARTSRGNLFENWDMGSDTDSMADEDLGADPDPDVMTAYDGASEDRSSNERTSNGGEPPSITHSTASLDSFDIAEILRLPSELLELWDLIDRNTEFLEACPTDSIMAD
jgi:hypothetical protein